MVRGICPWGSKQTSINIKHADDLFPYISGRLSSLSSFKIYSLIFNQVYYECCNNILGNFVNGIYQITSEIIIAQK